MHIKLWDYFDGLEETWQQANRVGKAMEDIIRHHDTIVHLLELFDELRKSLEEFKYGEVIWFREDDLIHQYRKALFHSVDNDPQPDLKHFVQSSPDFCNICNEYLRCQREEVSVRTETSCDSDGHQDQSSGS